MIFTLTQKKIEKNIGKIEKRIRCVIATFAMTSFMLLSTFFPFDKALIFIPIFIILAYLLTYFAVLEGIEKNERIVLFIMPIFFSIALYLFYFLIPTRWLTRVPIVVIYAVSLYALLLVSNIFNVGVEKSLQLFRAAFSINYFYQILIIFLILNVFLSFKFNFFVNGLLVFLVMFPLSLQFLWSVKPKIDLEKRLVLFALFLSLIFAQLAIVFSFVPIKTSIFALGLSASYYSLSGLIYSYLDERLFKETIREYLIVIGFVLLIVVLSISW